MTTISPPNVERTPTLADRAYAALRDRLVTLQIRPGEPIDDDLIAEDLGVGRTPVREALKRLEDDRLVVAYPRRGTFATTVDITDLTHLNEVRLQLEPQAARRAAERATADERNEMSDRSPGWLASTSRASNAGFAQSSDAAGASPARYSSRPKGVVGLIEGESMSAERVSQQWCTQGPCTPT